MLIYDIEIIKAICLKGEKRIEGIEYAAGFDDHANLGISVIGTYDYQTNSYRAFLQPDFREFEKLAVEKKVISFNGILFDDMVCKANGLNIKTDYDILREIYNAAGLDPFPSFFTKAYSGFTLDSICYANKIGSKTGHGALAPVMWQQGKHKEVTEYCQNDVRLTKMLFDRIRLNNAIKHPRNSGLIIIVPGKEFCNESEAD